MNRKRTCLYRVAVDDCVHTVAYNAFEKHGVIFTVIISTTSYVCALYSQLVSGGSHIYVYQEDSLTDAPRQRVNRGCISFCTGSHFILYSKERKKAMAAYRGFPRRGV